MLKSYDREIMKEFIILVIAMFVINAAIAGEGRTESDKAKESVVAEKRNHVLSPFHTEKYEYYEVCGCCEKDLQCEMMDKAIRWKDGNKYDSITKWKVKWDYAYSRDDNACFTDSFRVNIEITFHLPKWVCGGQPPPSLAEKWESYIRNLNLHEKGHGDRALKTAEDLTHSVAELAPARSCSELDRQVQRLCSERMKRLDEEQEEYDAATEHGQIHGISFP